MLIAGITPSSHASIGSIGKGWGLEIERMGNLHYRADLERALGRSPSWYHYGVLPALHPGVRAVLCHRIAARLIRIPGLRFGGRVWKRIGLWTTGAEISPEARIGPGLSLPHPIGVVIGPRVTIEGDCTVFQGVTLGPRRADPTIDDTPTIARHTFIYPGAKVLGKIRVGPRTQIGPNCVVFTDIPEGSTVLPPTPTILEGLSFTLRERASSPTESRRAEAAS